MTELAQRLAALAPEQRALLQAKLRNSGVQLSPGYGIPKRPEGSDIPLSLGQESLWLFHQMAPDASVHNISNAYRVKGPLDLPILWRVINEIARRHETLRTTIHSVDGNPFQRVAPSMTVPPRVVDLASVPAELRESELERVTVKEARDPYDLESDPLFRCLVVRLSEEDHVIVATMHHIITDWWSVGIFERELSALYRAFIAGRPSPLPELPVQFGDYSTWQRQPLRGADLEKQIQYWKEQLADAPELTEIVPDRPRSQLRSFRGGRRYFKLRSASLEGLRALGQKEGASLFMTLLAAFDVLLYRYTGQDDVLVGSPIANRTRSETQGLIGYLMNIQVLRTDLSGDPSFRSLLTRVRSMALGAYAHPDLTYGRIAQELKSTPHLSHNPLFQTMFILLVPTTPETPIPGWTNGWMVDNGTEEFDFNLALWENEEYLWGRVEYNADLYDAETIDRIVSHYERLLSGIVDDPDIQISRLSLIPEAEQQQILKDWNAMAQDSPGNARLVDLLQAQVARSPDSVAVVFENETMTYRQLDERAARLALHLQSRGVATDTLVGICLERSAEMVVALLGVLKSGGAYLPLEPSLPRERLEFMLEDAQPALILTQQRLREYVPVDPSRLICLDAGQLDDSRGSAGKPKQGVSDASQLAYGIYTSGSTGKPKGVLVSRNALTNTLLSMSRNPGLGSNDTLLAVTNLSFDIAALEFFLPLMVGARLVVAGQEQAGDAAKLAKLLASSGATVMQATPATWRMLLDAEWPGSPDLKVFCGGEALPLDTARELSRRCGSLWNLYGPTETTIWSSVAKVDGTGDTVAIGPPISNTQFYVLDSRLQPLPIGIPGELHIGGASVARGYLNRPGLTAERFIPDPFSSEPGARLYKTGDRVRWRADGNLEFHGRLDFQVKIRGFRIELGEVEAVLAGHAGVRESVVVARPGATGGDERLVAYIVPQGPAPSIDDLRSYLRAKLPDYMVPSAVVVLERLPLTSNGKLDRRALPAPDFNQTSAVTYVAPRTEAEKLLAGIWAQVLGVDRVGLHDNFFDLGGHSLLATQAISRVRRAFGVEPSLVSLFQAPTVAEFVEILVTSAKPSDQFIRSRSEVHPRRAADILQRMDQLSDEEIEELLNKLAAKESSEA